MQGCLPRLRAELSADLVVANGENLAAGYGVTPSTLKSLLSWGVDIVTSGNHVWDRPEGIELLDEEPRLLRPANYPAGNPGRGCHVVDVGERKVAVINLQGRVFMTPIDDPFEVGRRLADEVRGQTNIIVVDFHAEATAEKCAFARYMDGSVTAVVGTHTHVPTADARVLPGGTAYVTDLGLTGSHAGVIGYASETAIKRAALGRRVRFKLADGDLRLQGALVDVDVDSGLAKSIDRIDLPYEEE